MTMKAKLRDKDGQEAEISIDEFKDLQNRVDNLEYLKVKNGEEKVMPTIQAIAEIWEAVEPLRDIKKVREVFLKYPRFTKWLLRAIVTGGILTLIRWFVEWGNWAMTLFK